MSKQVTSSSYSRIYGVKQVGARPKRREGGSRAPSESDVSTISQSETSSTQAFIERYITKCEYSKIRPVEEVLRQARNGSRDGLSILLEDIELGENGLSCLVYALKLCRTIVSLTVRGIPIGDNGAEEIASLTASSRSLRSLSLESAEVGERGGIVLAGAIGENPLLTVLDLTANKIGNEAGEAFGTGLRRNTHLQTLVLTRNRITDRGGVLLCEAFRENATLQRLALGNNTSLGFRTAQVLVEVLQTNHMLTTVDVSHSSIGRAQLDSISGLLEDNVRRRLLEVPHSIQPTITTSVERPPSVESPGPSIFELPPPHSSPAARRVSAGVEQSSHQSISPGGVSSIVGSPMQTTIGHADLVRKCRDIIEIPKDQMSEKDKVGQMVALFHASVHRMNEYSSKLAISEEKLAQSRGSVSVLTDRLKAVTSERDRMEAAYRTRLGELENAMQSAEEMSNEREAFQIRIAQLERREDALATEVRRYKESEIMDRQRDDVVTKLKTKIRKLEDQNREIGDMLSHSNKELTRVSGKWTTQTEQFNEQQSKLVMLQKELQENRSRMVAVVEREKEKDENCKKDIADRDHTIETLRARLNSHVGALQQSQSERDIEGRLKEDELSDMKEVLWEIESKLKVSEERVASFEQEKEEKDDEIGELKQKLEEQNALLDEYGSRCEEAENERNSLRKSMTDIRGQLKSRVDESETFQFRLQEAEATRSTSVEEKEELNTLLERAVRELEASTSSLMRSEHERKLDQESAKNAAREYRAKIDSLEEKASTLSEKSTELESSLSQKVGALEKTKLAFDQVNRELAQRNSEASSTVEEVEKLRNDEKSRSAELRTLRKDIERMPSLEERIQDLQKEISSRTTIMSSLKEQMKRKETQIVDAEAHIREVKDDNRELRQTVQNLEDELMEGATRIKKLQGVLQAKSRDLEEAVHLMAEMKRNPSMLK